MCDLAPASLSPLEKSQGQTADRDEKQWQGGEDVARQPTQRQLQDSPEACAAAAPAAVERTVPWAPSWSHTFTTITAAAVAAISVGAASSRTGGSKKGGDHGDELVGEHRENRKSSTVDGTSSTTPDFDGGGSLSSPAPWKELMLTAGRRHRWVVAGWGRWWAVASGVADERWGRAATSGAGGGLRRRRVGRWGWVVVTPRRALGESSDVRRWGRWRRRRVQR
uniref:Uncharacterized protein n=1 Tax=Oryza meridionalis TaxID=40149 RepID=A0A0E0E7F9_9ORYZ